MIQEMVTLLRGTQSDICTCVHVCVCVGGGGGGEMKIVPNNSEIPYHHPLTQ